MTRRTPAPRPRTDSDELADVLARRRRTGPVEPASDELVPDVAPAAPIASDALVALIAPSAPEAATPVPAAPAAPAMSRRSWYMPTDIADELARLVDDLHFETRRPKHAVLAALLRAGLDHVEDARHTLTS